MIQIKTLWDNTYSVLAFVSMFFAVVTTFIGGSVDDDMIWWVLAIVCLVLKIDDKLKF